MQRNDILKLLFETPYEALRERADEVRAREKGEHVFVRGLNGTADTAACVRRIRP